MGTNEVSVALDSDISLNNDNIAITNLTSAEVPTDVNDTAGVNGYVPTTVGTGVSWREW